MVIKFNEDKQQKIYQDLRIKEEEEQAKRLAAKLKLPYINLFLVPIDAESIKIIEEEKAREGELVSISKLKNELKIAVVNPEKEATKKILKNLNETYKTSLFVVSRHSLEKALNIYKTLPKKYTEITGEVNISNEVMEKFQKEIKNIKKFTEIIEKISKQNTSLILELIISGALSLNSSDIHIEGEKNKKAKIRLRIDGLLRDITEFDEIIYKKLTSRIKLLSEMVLNVHDIAQDGRFTIKIEGESTEVRVSLIPGAYGENFVLRVLNPKSLFVNLEDLGFRKDDYEIVQREIQKPNGMILCTGPTGSGKTTALYAFLKKINSPEIKIITLEDPIEYKLEGITQTQIEPDKGYTFALGLRAILRQDPDVVLVGEMRDFETANTAINAALTGHIVFSTLHTNDAPGTIPRLIDMGVNPKIIPPAINVAIGQRLVRRLCKECKKEYKATPEEIKKIENVLKKITRKIEYKKIDNNLKLYKPVGCEICNNTGYKGRIGVYELFLIDDEMEKLIVKSPTEAEVRDLAIKKGMTTMKQDGFIKIINGITTIEEVESVVG